MTTREITRPADFRVRFTADAVKAIDGDERRVRFVATHEKVDRQDDLILLAGMDLDPYGTNPTLNKDHDYHTQIGTVVLLRIESRDGAPALIGEAVLYPPGVSVAADAVWREMQAGGRRGISIGFRALAYELRGDGPGVVFTKTELLEISSVVVPACATCLIESKSACACGGGADPDEVIIRFADDEMRESPTGGISNAIPTWLTEARRLLAAGAVGNPDERYAPLRHTAIPAIDEVLASLTAGLPVQSSEMRSLRSEVAALRRELRSARQPAERGDDVVVRFHDDPSDEIAFDPADLPGAIAGAAAKEIGDVVNRELTAALDYARGRISD